MADIFEQMNQMFLGNIKKDAMRNSILSNKKDVLESDRLKKEIETFAKEDVVFNQNKKEMQKMLMKKYIAFLDANEEEIFESFGLDFINFEKLERIALFVKYNKNLNASELIKKIKNFNDITLEELIAKEYAIQASLVTLSESVKKTSINWTSLVFKSAVLLTTAKVVKAIKYDYLSYNIAYFDKNNKPKKVFINKKIHLSMNGFCFVDKNQLTIEKLADYLHKNYFKFNKELALNEIIDNEISSYSCIVTDTINFVYDEYTKLILGEKYLEYISNRVSNLIDVTFQSVTLDVFLHRKVLMPKSGILLLVKNDKGIESILLKEVYKFNTNHFVAITKYKDGKEISNVFTLNEECFTHNIYWVYKKEIEFRTIDYIIHFLDSMDIDEEFDDMKYEVISPTYWKYRNRGYKSENDKTDYKGVVIKREFEIEIAPFIRKIDGVASNEAKSLAKKLGVILEDGHTIVKPHIRHYNKQK